MFGIHPDAIKQADQKYAKAGPMRGGMVSPEKGFHPQMYLAGGGFIDGLKRAVGLKEDTPEQKAYKERAAAERAAAKSAPPVAAPPPQKAITSYSTGAATAERMKVVDAMADGGEVVGPGTGTSDEVPIMGSNGEYMIRKAAVDVVGINVLDAINALGEDASDDDDADDKEPGKYATGGVISKYGTELPNSEDEQKQLAARTANYVAGAQATAAQRPAAQVVAANPTRAPAPQLAPLQGNSAFDYVAGDTVAAAKGAFSGAGDSFSQGNYSEGLGKLSRGGLDTGLAAARGIMTPGIAVADNLVSSAGNFARGFMGSTSTPAPNPAATAATPATAAPAPTPTPQRPSATVATPNPATGSPDQTVPGGIVNVSRQANGVTSFSGKDIAGQPQYAGSAVGGIRAGAMNSVPGMSQSEITKTLTNPDGSQWSSRDNAIMAANIRDGIDPYRGTSQGQANDLRALALSPNGTPGKANAMKLLALQSDEKRTTGQQQIERDRNAQQSQGTALDNQAKQQVLAAQQELANAKTPAEEAAAEKKLRALQGKYGKDLPEQYAYAPGGQTIDPVTGQAVTQPGVIFNKATGEVKQPGQSGKAIDVDPRAIAIRDNKSMSRDQKLAELKKMGYQ